MVLGGDYTAAALLLADGPELDIAAAAVDAVDVVGAAVAGEGAFFLSASAGVVAAVVFEDVGFAVLGPGGGVG